MAVRRLSFLEREEIDYGCRWGVSFAAIGRRLDRPTSTISREVSRHGGRREYRCWFAQLRTQEGCRRPKTPKLIANRPLAEAVEQRLGRRWSPEQVAHRLRMEHPHDPSWWVSHETIYQALFLQGRGGLRRELCEALRTGRARRRPRGVHHRRGAGSAIADKVLIAERPPEVEDRAVPGHWEGDLLLGANKQSQVGTLVERTSRLVLLVHLPESRRAEIVADAIAAKITALPDQLRLTLTWDQGGEMGAHKRFTVATGVQVYFCDPRSPWQRGTVENTNGLLRQYLPKGAVLSTVPATELDAIAAELNDRPRKGLGWMTPSEKFAELVAMTA
jgi:transposase, IS30 family